MISLPVLIIQPVDGSNLSYPPQRPPQPRLQRHPRLSFACQKHPPRRAARQAPFPCLYPAQRHRLFLQLPQRFRNSSTSCRPPSSTLSCSQMRVTKPSSAVLSTLHLWMRSTASLSMGPPSNRRFAHLLRLNSESLVWHPPSSKRIRLLFPTLQLRYSPCR